MDGQKRNNKLILVTDGPRRGASFFSVTTPQLRFRRDTDDVNSDLFIWVRVWFLVSVRLPRCPHKSKQVLTGIQSAICFTADQKSVLGHHKEDQIAQLHKQTGLRSRHALKKHFNRMIAGSSPRQQSRLMRSTVRYSSNARHTLAQTLGGNVFHRWPVDNLSPTAKRQCLEKKLIPRTTPRWAQKSFPTHVESNIGVLNTFARWNAHGRLP